MIHIKRNKGIIIDEKIGEWVYSGQIIDIDSEMIPDGIGKIVHQKYNIIYEGEFKYSAYHGYGRILYNKFGLYEGKFAQNCFKGKGKFIDLVTKDVNEGQFAETK